MDIFVCGQHVTPKYVLEATKKMYYFFPQRKVYTDVLQYHTVTLQCSVLNFFF